MDEGFGIAQRYFSPPAKHWWRWDDDGAFIELASGKAICPLEEVFSIVESLADTGLPDFDSIVLFLIATREDTDAFLYLLHHAPATRPVVEKIRELLAQDALSEAAKQSAAADYLFTKAGTTCPRDETNHILTAMRDVDFQNLSCEESSPEMESLYGSLLQQLTGISPPSAKQIETQHETGWERVPEADDLELDFPGQVRQLLLELAEQANWAPLHELTQQALAALSIPRSLNQKQDLPDGGYQDISNRGDLDRLLPGELAHDDELLLLRLSQGEALFLERERPPHLPAAREWLILDNGLRMWGEPKMLGLASALAIASQVESHQSLQVLRPYDGDLEPVPILTEDGLLDYLQSTEPHLGLCSAVLDFMKDTPDDTVLYLTDVRSRDEVVRSLVTIPKRTAPLYLLFVDYHGNVSLEEWSSSGLKPLRKASLALTDFDPTAPEGLEIEPGALPLYALRPCPIRLPYPVSAQKSFQIANNKLLCTSPGILLAEWTNDQSYPRILALRRETLRPIAMGRRPSAVWILTTRSTNRRTDWIYMELNPTDGTILLEQRLDRNFSYHIPDYCGFLHEQLLIVNDGKALVYDPASGAKSGSLSPDSHEHRSQHFYQSRDDKKEWYALRASSDMRLDRLENIPPDTVALADSDWGRYRVTEHLHVFLADDNRQWCQVEEGPAAHLPFDPKRIDVVEDGILIGDSRFHFPNHRWMGRNPAQQRGWFPINDHKQLGLRTQIQGIFVKGSQIGILNRKGNVQEFRFRDRCSLSTGSRGERNGCFYFNKSDEEGTLECTLPNGTRAQFDGNYVLHLIPADQEAPSISVVFIQQFFIGCTERGETFGHEKMLTGTPSMQPLHVKQLLQDTLGIGL